MIQVIVRDEAGFHKVLQVILPDELCIRPRIITLSYINTIGIGMCQV